MCYTSSRQICPYVQQKLWLVKFWVLLQSQQSLATKQCGAYPPLWDITHRHCVLSMASRYCKAVMSHHSQVLKFCMEVTQTSLSCDSADPHHINHPGASSGLVAILPCCSATDWGTHHLYIGREMLNPGCWAIKRWIESFGDMFEREV